MGSTYQSNRPAPDPLGRRAFLRRGAVAVGALTAAPTLFDRLPPLGSGAVAHDSAGLGSAVLAAAVDVPAPTIITRAEWGADESLRSGDRKFAPIRKLVVHHTDTANQELDPAARIRSIYAYHTQYRGWDDIGYNFLIDREGRIYEGRWAREYADGEVHAGEDAEGNGVIGAHAGGHNTGSMGVALLGTFTGTGVTADAFDSLVHLLAWKAAPRGIDPDGKDHANGKSWPNIAGHRDVSPTGCPGDRFYERLPELRTRVRAAMATGLVGYRVLADDGSITTFGSASDIGDLPRQGIRNAPVRGIAGTLTGMGAWVVGPDGGIFTFGDATFFGSMGGRHLNKPMVGMAPTASGEGYWTVASDGGIFTFGDARFHGSTGGMVLNKPIIGMAPTPTGDGYWLVASDGGMFTFGDAAFHGSTGGLALSQPITALTVTPSGEGYWLAGGDGTVFAFGDAPDLGSLATKADVARPVRSIRSTPTGQGYWLLDSVGGVYTFGDAVYFGAGLGGRRRALDIVPVVRP